MREAAFLMVRFRVGDVIITCPLCGSDKYFPAIMLKQKETRWYSECEETFFYRKDLYNG